ncbi:MAG: hypothetical protein IZT55_04145 [Anaerolineae bacterium]|nr:hypothetical protein [Anaerolineae bacterium]
MMDIFFSDPNDVPLPPEDVHIRNFSAEPWPDKHRVRIKLELSPFQKRPSGEIVINNAQSEQVAVANFIETMVADMEINLHLRADDTLGAYQAAVTLFYLAEIAAEERESESFVQPEKLQVDHAVFDFEIV